MDPLLACVVFGLGVTIGYLVARRRAHMHPVFRRELQRTYRDLDLEHRARVAARDALAGIRDLAAQGECPACGATASSGSVAPDHHVPGCAVLLARSGLRASVVPAGEGG